MKNWLFRPRARVALACVVAVTLLAAAPPLMAGDLSKAELKERFRQLGTLSRQLEDLEKGSVDSAKVLNKIGELRFPAAAKYLADLLTKSNPKTQQGTISATLYALNLEGSELSVKTILTLGFERLNEQQYYIIGTFLKEFRDPKAIDWIVTKGWKAIPKLKARGQDEWVKVLQATKDPRRVRAARSLIGDRRCVATTLVSMLSILEENPVKSDAKKVARLFRIKDKRVQVAALRALRLMEATDESKIFFKALGSRHWEVRATAVDVLRTTHQREVIPYIIERLEDSSMRVKIAAVAALQELGGDEVMSPLIVALEEAESGRLKDDIAEALVKLTGKDFGVVAANWQSWWNENQGKVEIASISREDYDRIKEAQEGASTAVGVYFGLRVISEGATFIIDKSYSMSEVYKVPVDDKKKKGETGKGRTAVPKGSDDKDKKAKKFKEKKKIEVAREELIKVLEHLRNGSQFNILPFSSELRPRPWKPSLVTMEDKVRTAAIEFVKGLQPGGMTNVYDTLMAALADPDVNTIYFLSDGAPTIGTYLDSKEILKRVGEANALRKVKIHTIGFHLDKKARKLMRDLAEQNYGRFVKR